MAETGSWLNREFKSGFQSRTWFKKKYWYIFLMNRGVDQIKRPPGWRVYNHTNSIELVGRVFAKVYACTHDESYPFNTKSLPNLLKLFLKPTLICRNSALDKFHLLLLRFVRALGLRDQCNRCIGTLYVDFFAVQTIPPTPRLFRFLFGSFEKEPWAYSVFVLGSRNPMRLGTHFPSGAVHTICKEREFPGKLAMLRVFRQLFLMVIGCLRYIFLRRHTTQRSIRNTFKGFQD